MRWILTLLLIPLTLSAQEQICRKISSIDYRSMQGTTVALITLDDRSTWKWVPDMYSENLLRKWREEDSVLIRVTNHPGFSLQNLSQPHYCPVVALSFGSYTLYPSIVSYENGIIELSDGTKWELIYDFNKRTLCHWALGDRIIPVQGILNNYELINLDIPYENRCQIERLVEVEPAEHGAEAPLEESIG